MMLMRALSRRLSLPADAATLSRAGSLFIVVFLMVVFEGAVRKWVASSATLPLILLRDMLAVYLVFYVWKRGYFRRQKSVTMVLLAWSCCVAGWGMLQVMLTDGNPLILLIGLRFWLLYLWFGYAAAVTMNESDYRAAMLVSGALLILLAPLAVLQYYSPPGAFINSQVDSVEDEVFVAVSGVVRTTGTFSFTSGYTTFLAVAAPLALAVASARKRTVRQLAFAGAVFATLVVGTVVSGSRGAVIFTGVLVGLFVLGQLLFSRTADKGKALVGAVALLGIAALFALVFQGAVDTTQQRFQQASEGEDFVERLLTTFIGESNIYNDFTWIGHGIGLGSNLANYVRTGSTSFFVLAETEAGRTLLEGGLLGYLFTALKVLVIVVGTGKSLAIALRSGAMVPLLLWLTFSLAFLAWSGIGQLTSNAMLGILFGFALLSLRYPAMDIFPRRLVRS